MTTGSYAYYRLPYAETYTVITQTSGEPERISQYAALNGRSGFVLAPFAITDDCPLLLIHPDTTETRDIKNVTVTNKKQTKTYEEVNTDDSNGTVRMTERTKTDDSNGTGGDGDMCGKIYADRKAYADDFADFHARLRSDEYSKIVLARSAEVETVGTQEAEELFLRACRMYPRMFVVLVSTPHSGTWLAATPEILLEGSRGVWRTIALAGTMKLEGRQLDFDSPPSKDIGDKESQGINDKESKDIGDKESKDIGDKESGIYWSTKNIQEQRYVATYIAESMKPFVTDCREEGPRTVRAGEVVHLRSDFTFCLKDKSHLGDVLAALHPTPAVCGLPKAETWRHIVEHEHTVRRYYSGFVGPLTPDGETHLYVSLRCMQILDGRHYRLYAGGGLLRDSIEEQEWRETEAKMGTMLDCLKSKS